MLTLLFFGQALRSPTRSVLAAWSTACVAALLTHYFAGFLVSGEAVCLFACSRRRIRIGVACTPVALAVAALAPLAVHQRAQGHATFIASTSLGSRVLDTAKVFVFGPTGEIWHQPSGPQPGAGAVPVHWLATQLFGAAQPPH